MRRILQLGVARITGVLCLLLAVLLQTAAAAGTFPDKPVNMIIPFSAGGASDVQARIMERYWNRYAPVKWNFIYKPGGGGALGFTEIARARPDGFTIGNINVPHIILQPLAGKVPYTADDFELLCQVVSDPACLVVRAASPLRTADDLFRAARTAPKKIKGALMGPLTGHHLMHMDITSRFDFPITPVFYKGGADQVAAVLGGEVDFAYGSLSEWLRVKDEVRILGVATALRHELAPETPTLREQGYDITSGQIRRGYAAPRGLAPERLRWLRDTFDKIGNDPDYAKEMEKLRFPARYLNAAAFGAAIDAEKGAAAEAFGSMR